MRILGLQNSGLSYGAISAVLNREGVPTPTGQPVWGKSYVDRLLHTRYVMELRQGMGMPSDDSQGHGGDVCPAGFSGR
jgi:hypothetical protein